MGLASSSNTVESDKVEYLKLSLITENILHVGRRPHPRWMISLGQTLDG